VFNLSHQDSGSVQVQLESLNSTAHLGSPLPAKGRGARLLLVRHGETDWNRQGRFQGQIDIPLNANGLAQAEAAGGFLAPVAIHRAYTSSMARPRQTAEAILASHPGVPLTSTTGLVEIGHGLWEGRLESEIGEGWPELLADWKRAPETVQMPEGETIHDVWQRSLRTWQTIAATLEEQETALVVAHDAVNKTILCALLGLTPADIWMIKQGNGGVTVIDYPHGSSGTAVVAAMNLTSHLGGVLDRTAAGAL
jgi:probable phosphoglycerate mutase